MGEEKSKRDGLTPEMRERIMVNRTGKLTSNQWIDMIMQPVVALILVMTPGIFLMPRLLLLLARGGWIVLLMILVGIVASLVFRAYRYARAPIYFAEMTAGTETPPWWMFWRPLILTDETGARLKFGKRLAPRPILRRGNTYLVYYLREPGDNVLLSIAPGDHPDAANWQPDRVFEARFRHRGGGD